MKVAGRWRYVYRAIDQFGQVIDVFVSPRRDVTAARRFFERAIRETKTMPVEVVTDLGPVYPATVWMSCCQGLGIAPTGMATTVSKQITAG